MQLTLYTDYSLRTLLYLGMHAHKKATISEIADYFQISRNHLVKVVHNLANCGYIHTMRGKGGGMYLARPPEEINIGDVIRHTEPNFHIVECYNTQASHCPIVKTCGLIGVLNGALTSFFSVLDQYTLAVLLKKQDAISTPLQIIPSPSPATAHRTVEIKRTKSITGKKRKADSGIRVTHQS